MTDINFTSSQRDGHNSASSGEAAGTSDADALAIIEQLFFAYRDFVGEPDEVLAELGFGRAHHRVLHFVHRNPGMTVAVLLDILQITKQSLARVLKHLIETGYIAQEEGPQDRRQRLLRTTEKGSQLAERLIAIQSSRIKGALRELPPAERASVQVFLRALRNSGTPGDPRATSVAQDG